MVLSVYNMRVRFEIFLVRSKDYVFLRKRSLFCVKVEIEKDVKVEIEVDNEIYIEMNIVFFVGFESCVFYFIYILFFVNYNYILFFYVCSSVSVDLSLSRFGSYRDFSFVFRFFSYGYLGFNFLKFDL